MLKKLIFSFFFLAMAAASLAFAQDGASTPDNSSMPDNKELIARGHSFFVHSNTLFVRREQLENGLLAKKEFHEMGLQITNDPAAADFILEVHRIPFQNNFDYTVTDRRTTTVVMAGQTQALLGRVFGAVFEKIANQIVVKVKKARESLQQESSPPAVAGLNRY